MYEQFKTRAEAVGAELHRFRTEKEALRFVAEFIQHDGAADTPGSRVVCTSDLMEMGFGHFKGDTPPLAGGVTQQMAADAKFGISRMEWGLADTGTLVQDASEVDQRLVSTLPEIHIALLATARILPDMASLLPHIYPAQSAYISMITGPSRTADIERVLTIGVHGPKRLIIVCSDEQGEHQ